MKEKLDVFMAYDNYNEVSAKMFLFFVFLLNIHREIVFLSVRLAVEMILKLCK